LSILPGLLPAYKTNWKKQKRLFAGLLRAEK